MPVSTVAEYWKLAVESRLLTVQQGQQLQASYEQIKGIAGAGSPRALAEWLVSINTLSRYQASVLLSGRPGPFFYGEYKVYDRIDSGRWKGMFRAVHAATNHPVLLQFATGPVTQNALQWGYIVTRTQTRLAQPFPHWHRFFEAVDLGTFKFLVAEDPTGETLEERLSRTGRLAPPNAVFLARQAALALAQVHRDDVAHGDVRPANLWIEPHGRLLLLQDPTQLPTPWNLSAHEKSALLLAKADYAAPELGIAGKLPDCLTDIYGLGCTLYQMLAGQPPFTGGDCESKFRRHAGEAIQPLGPLGVPEPLAQMVAYMMAKNPSVRLQSAAQIAQQLTGWIDPTALVINAVPPAPTLAAYELHLGQRAATSVGTVPAVPPPPPPPIPIGTSPAAPSSAVALRSSGSIAQAGRARAPRRSNQQTLLWVGGGAAALLVLVVLIVMAMSGGSGDQDKRLATDGGATTSSASNGASGSSGVKPPPRTSAGGEGTTKKTAEASTSPATAPRQEVIADDGKALWASPTNGEAVDFQFVPPGGQVFLIVRPADLLATDEGPRVLRGLGPAFEAEVRSWETAAGVRLKDIEQLILTLHDNGEDFPRPSIVVRPLTAVPTSELLTRWGDPKPLGDSVPHVYRGASWSYFLPPSEEGRLFVIGATEETEKVATETKGAPPALRREMETLRHLTDSQRHFSLLLAPNYLSSTMFRDGRKFYFGDARKVREPLDWFLKDELQAVLFSLHCGTDTYLELRLSSNLNKDKFQLATELRDRLAQVPDVILDYIATIGSNPYWERVRLLYPNMIRTLHRMTRVGVEDQTAVVNCVLPGPAAHNLTFGSEMVLASAPGATVVAVAPSGPAKPSPASMSIDDVMGKFETSMMFEAQSLEFALQDVAKDVNESLKGLPFEFKIKILGDDLKLDGITRNQTVRDFNQRGKSVGDILTAMVMKANPVTTVKDPSEKDQKLLWVIDKDPDDPSKPIVLITTRQMAEQRKYKLPKPFEPK